MLKKGLIVLLAGLAFQTLCGFTCTYEVQLNDDGTYTDKGIETTFDSEEERKLFHSLDYIPLKDESQVRKPTIVSKKNMIIVNYAEAKQYVYDYIIKDDMLEKVMEAGYPFKFKVRLTYEPEVAYSPVTWINNNGVRLNSGGYEFENVDYAYWGELPSIYNYFDKEAPTIQVVGVGNKRSKKNGLVVYKDISDIRCTEDIGLKEATFNGETSVDYGYKHRNRNGLNTVTVEDYGNHKCTLKFYLDNKAPTIKGIKNKKTYKKKSITFYVKDSIAGIESIKVDGKKAKNKVVKSGKYKGYSKVTIKRKKGKKNRKVTVEDKVGNTKTYSIKLK